MTDSFVEGKEPHVDRGRRALHDPEQPSRVSVLRGTRGPATFRRRLNLYPAWHVRKHIYQGAKGRPVSAFACARWTARKASAWFRFTMSTCHSRIRRKASELLWD